VGITAGSREVPGRNACDRRHTYCIIIIIITTIINYYYYYYYYSEQTPQVSHMTAQYGRNHKHFILIQKSCTFARTLQGVMFRIFGIIQYLEA